MIHGASEINKPDMYDDWHDCDDRYMNYIRLLGMKVHT